MRELAHKLIGLYEEKKSEYAPSVILGTAGTLSRNLAVGPEYRIGLWPCLSESHPETAMGLMTVLAYLLEQWQGIRVYREFAALEGEPESYQWTIEKSQFDVDGWRFDALDDNVGIWGRLSGEGENWTLRIEVENDVTDSDDTDVFEYTAASPERLVDILPDAAKSIVLLLNPDAQQSRGGVYSKAERDNESVADVLELAFLWELELLLSLWGKAVDLEKLFADLVEAAGDLQSDDEFGGWLAASAASRLLLPGFFNEREALPPVESVVTSLPDSHLAPVILAQSLFYAGESQTGIALLETEVSRRTDDASTWLILANLYRIGGRLAETVDTFQRAIEAEAVSSGLMVSYANLLPLMQSQGWDITEFIMIDLADVHEDYITWEAIESYEEALKLKADNPAAILSRQIALLIELGADKRTWSTFQRLVEVDLTGDYVRASIDEFFALENINPAIEVLREAVDKHTDRVDLKTNLAALYIADERGEIAEALLQEARSMTGDEAALADIQRLMLAAQDPEFEATLGEIIDRLEAKNALSDEQVEFLENVVEEAPAFVDGYVLLAQAYILWEEPATALETLLEAEKHNPLDPEVIFSLGKLLWESDQNELAFTYLNKGIEAAPLHVPMLSLIGQYLYEDGQPDEARVYLARAGAIAKRHPALLEAQATISRIMNERSDQSDEDE